MSTRGELCLSICEDYKNTGLGFFIVSRISDSKNPITLIFSFMKYFIILFSALFFSACTLNSSNSPIKNTITTESPSATTSLSGELEYSSTGDIALDLSMNYEYLDSENKKFSSGTLGDIISRTPYTIVYFYPKDGTPNCTIQALDFSLMKEDFLAKGYQIIGVSADNADSHMQFAERNELRIALLEDLSGTLLEQFGNK